MDQRDIHLTYKTCKYQLLSNSHVPCTGCYVCPIWIEICKINSWAYKLFSQNKPFADANANWGHKGVNWKKSVRTFLFYLFSSKNFTAALNVCVNMLCVCFERSSVLPFLKSSMNGRLRQKVFFLKHLSFPKTLDLILRTQCVRNKVSQCHLFLKGNVSFLSNFLRVFSFKVILFSSGKHLYKTLDFIDLKNFPLHALISYMPLKLGSFIG